MPSGSRTKLHKAKNDNTVFPIGLTLRPFYFRGVAASCSKVDMQIVDTRRREQFFYHRFDFLPVDQSVIDNHYASIERPHCKHAFAELFRNFINFVVGLIALPLKADIAQTFSETEPNVARI